MHKTRDLHNTNKDFTTHSGHKNKSEIKIHTKPEIRTPFGADKIAEHTHKYKNTSRSFGGTVYRALVNLTRNWDEISSGMVEITITRYTASLLLSVHATPHISTPQTQQPIIEER